MRKKRTLRRAAALAALLLAGGLVAGWFRLRAALPDTFTLAPGQALTVGSLPFLQAGAPSAGPAAAAGKGHKGEVEYIVGSVGHIYVFRFKQVAVGDRLFKQCAVRVRIESQVFHVLTAYGF